MKKTLFAFLLLLVFFFSNAQDDIAIGQWRVHVSYRQGLSLTESSGKIYFAAKGGFFALNKSDNSYELLSKVTGLSDASVTVVNADPVSGTVLAAYSNSNVDIIQGSSITNISDIKRKSILGNKAINNIYFNNGYAYLACGFGIVVIDIANKEVKDTYYIGALGAAVNVYEVTSNATDLFAATENGIYTASLASANLADYSSWSKMSGLPAGDYNTICHLNGKVYANFLKGPSQDSIFVYDGTSWSNFTWVSGYNTRKMNVINGKLVIAFDYNVDVYDDNQVLLNRISNYGFDYALPLDGIIDAGNTVWIADQRYGLMRSSVNNSGEKFVPSGPWTNGVRSMSVADDKLWLVPGTIDGSWNNGFTNGSISVFSENSWSNLTGQQGNYLIDSIKDIAAIAVNPNNSARVYAGTWGHGVVELTNGQITNVYNTSNSTLKNNLSSGPYVRVAGVAFDEDDNAWFTNSEQKSALHVRKKNGTWQAFDFTPFISIAATVSSVIALKNGQKWFVLPSNPNIIVFNNNGSFPVPNTSNTKVLSTAANFGAIPGAKVYSIAEDLEGQVWIGTEKGVAVFFSPDNIFSGGNYDAQQIYVEQDGHTQLLLETETVTAIAVDGANRKWLGTQKAGVFLMSADGTKQIYHFDESNSPLLSNAITSIAVNGSTGEVFFGTANGVISYRSTATEGGEDFENVYAFPNPVKHDYAGVIAIKGLIKNAEVKITDVAGNLIYQTKAEGGQAVWPGTNFSGERAHTGVYFVHCANEDGSKTFVTKILFIN